MYMYSVYCFTGINMANQGYDWYIVFFHIRSCVEITHMYGYKFASCRHYTWINDVKIRPTFSFCHKYIKIKIPLYFIIL